MRRWLFRCAGQGFEAGGHGVLKGGSARMPDNKINGVDFILPFRFHNGAWQLGTRGPISLRIAGMVNGHGEKYHR